MRPQFGLVSILLAVLFHVVQSLDEGSFWHVTDFHYDFSYHDEGFSCTKTVAVEDRGPFGIGWCDPPWTLVNSSVHAMRNLHPDVDFIIWTGDNVLHAKHEEDQLGTSINLDILDNITNLLADVFPNTVTYPCYGNHDYFPNAQFPVTENAIYQHMAESWSVWLNSSSIKDTLSTGGYYTALTNYGKVRLVALNTNLYYSSNKQVAKIYDPADQLTWLDGVLTNATINQEKVIITGHVPPGVKTPDGFMWFYEDHNRHLNEVIKNHTDVIAAIHLGHDHEDEFKIYYSSSDDTARIPVFLAPAISTWRYVSKEKTGRVRNPGIRLVKYDRDTGRHLDYFQYYLDLEKANREGHASWTRLYEAKAAYNIPDLSAKSLGTVRERLLSRESSPIQAYFTRMGMDGDVDTQCDRECRDAIYCGMRHFDMASYRSCLVDVSSGGVRRYSIGLIVFCLILTCTGYY
ncbi:acid sphingomyelinase-like phosphodiesterase 3b [Liolophura sinensis]|uniref:acid sphingomyelinase-like phosphodiesterase 3b n=1 Tax=Liolophura sinensis TaxID=3198878 RepID=UPI003158C65B